MHPFALNDEVLDQINGAGGTRDLSGDPIFIEIPPGDIPETTLAIGEEGGGWTPPPDDGT